MMKKLGIQWSPVFTLVLSLLAAIGYYLGAGIQLKLSLTDLLPNHHPAVVKFEKLTEVVGGVGYFTIVLKAEDKASHLKVAPILLRELKKNPLVRDAYITREQRFFTDRLMYYLSLEQLRELEANIGKEITSAKRKMFDIGLWDDEDAPAAKKAPIFDEKLKEHARKSAGVTENLVSTDGQYLLVMVKPSFDSMDLGKTKELIVFSEKVLKDHLPSGVTYDFSERYYRKVVETDMVQSDIFILGTLSIVLIALIIFAYMRSLRAMLIIFVPVILGMGITVGLTRVAIGHINIITGFLMGIVSGLGVDYGIHLLLRLRLEEKEPSSDDPDPVWRTLASSGHSVFVGAVAAAMAFFLLCFSSFRAFSEFGFICGVGILAVLACLLLTFSALARFFKLDVAARSAGPSKLPPFPVLKLPRGLVSGLVVTAILLGLAFKVDFEYDFDKMMQYSQKITALTKLVNEINGRSITPSALSATSKDEAIAVEKLIKDKYSDLVADVISGATIVPDHQQEKAQILARIKTQLAPLKDKWIQQFLDIPGSAVRNWMEAKPFTITDLPLHLQDALRGRKDNHFLLWLYPAVDLSNANGVRAYANMIRDIEAKYPDMLTGSDAVVFADILDLINRDGGVILLVIFLSVGLFIWMNVRKWDDTLLSYLPLLLSLPVGMGLMAIFGVKFNIFNIAIIPTFVAMGIDVPIHIVHRMRETGSGYKAARDLATSINLALLTAGVGFGVLVFARAGVLKSLGWIALIGTLAIWWVGLFVLPALLEQFFGGPTQTAVEAEA